jgi:hypothetical protein
MCAGRGWVIATIKQIIAMRLKEHTSEHWLEILNAADIWCAEVLDWPELCRQSGFQATCYDTNSQGLARNPDSHHAPSASSERNSADERATRSPSGATHRYNPAAVWALAQPVYADSIVVEQLSLVDFARRLCDRPQCLYPPLIAGGERADGPVAPEEHAVPAEASNRMFNERP